MGGARPVEQSLLIEAVNALKQCGGSKKDAAAHLGLPVGTLKGRLRIAARQGIRGDYPEFDLVHPAAPGMVVKGTSIRYNGDGSVDQYWNKTRIEGADPDEVVRLPDPKTITKISTLFDQEGRVSQQWIQEKPAEAARIQAWKIFAEELAADLPRLDPVPAPEVKSFADMMSCFPVGDHHLGMAAWAGDADEDHDIPKGETMIRGAMDYLLGATPVCEQGLIVFLGDFMHFDSVFPVTPTSHNSLDAAGRFPQMVRAAIRSMRYMIESALKRHRQVHVIVEIGNHDLSSSIFLMECLRNVYENEPRITIDTSPKHYHYFQFGQVLIGTHHGHGAKMDQLPIIMATDRPKEWGETKHRFIWTGHVHHNQQKDIAGVDVESFRILPPQDAWAAAKGYRSIRDMKAIVMHREYGEVARHVVKPEMLGL